MSSACGCLYFDCESHIYLFFKLAATWHHSGKRSPFLPYKDLGRSEDLRHARGVCYGKWIRSNLCMVIMRLREVAKGKINKMNAQQSSSVATQAKVFRNSNSKPLNLKPNPSWVDATSINNAFIWMTDVNIVFDNIKYILIYFS